MRYAITGAWSIYGLSAAVLTIIFGCIAWKYPKWESKLKNPLWIIPLIIFFLILFIRLITAPYIMHVEEEKTIAGLKDNQTKKEDTKQAIRSFLESVNPVILKKVDAGQKEIHVLISAVKETKLSELSELSDFNKYLSFKQLHTTMQGPNYDGNDADIIKAVKSTLGDFIPELKQYGFVQGYSLYPQDALIK